MRIEYVKDLAKIYHMNTGEDFFNDYPKMIETLKELEAYWEAPNEDGWLSVGTKRSNGAKNEKWLKKYNIKNCVVKLHDISKMPDVAKAEDDDDDDDRMEMNSGSCSLLWKSL